MSSEMQRIRDIRTIARYGEHEAPEAFAGVTRGGEDEDAILVGFTSDAEAHLARLRERVEQPGHLRLFPARRTLLELRRSDEQMLYEAEKYRFDTDGFVVDGSGIEIERNAIVWDVFARDREAVAEFVRKRYGDILEIEFFDFPPFERKQVSCSAFDVSDGGRVMRVAYTTEASFREVEITSTETKDKVKIELWVQEYQGTSILEVRPAWVEVQLEEPVGDRRVIDGLSGATVPRVAPAS